MKKIERTIVEDRYGNRVDITPEPEYKCSHCGEYFPKSEFGERGKKVCSMCEKTRQ